MAEGVLLKKTTVQVVHREKQVGRNSNIRKARRKSEKMYSKQNIMEVHYERKVIESNKALERIKHEVMM